MAIFSQLSSKNRSDESPIILIAIEYRNHHPIHHNHYNIHQPKTADQVVIVDRAMVTVPMEGKVACLGCARDVSIMVYHVIEV